MVNVAKSNIVVFLISMCYLHPYPLVQLNFNSISNNYTIGKSAQEHALLTIGELTLYPLMATIVAIWPN